MLLGALIIAFATALVGFFLVYVPITQSVADCTGPIIQECPPNKLAAPVAERTCAVDTGRYTLVAILNDRWRVVDEGNQWILQVRKGRKTAKATGWRDKSFCTQRTTLLRCIHDDCGDVNADAMSVINQLPDQHRRASRDNPK